MKESGRKNTNLSLGNHLHFTIETISVMNFSLLGYNCAYKNEQPDSLESKQN